MYPQESYRHPTGRFPSVETESVMRANFLSTENNPLYDHVFSNLENLGFEYLSGYVASHFLALNYGLHFYNLVSNYTLYPEDEYPKFEIVSKNGWPTTYITPESDITYINIKGSDFEGQYMRYPSDNLALIKEPEIVFPIFITHILAGIEEASHLHLQRLQREHGANYNSQNDSDDPNIWQAGVVSSIEYGSQLWHEFAALTVQRMFIQYYLSSEYPVEVAEFEVFYKQVQSVREQWNAQTH